MVRQCFIAGLVTSVTLEQLHKKTVGGYKYNLAGEWERW